MYDLKVATERISRLSTEYVKVILCIWLDDESDMRPMIEGQVPYMAFMSKGFEPDVEEAWHPAEWDTDGSNIYIRCLVGPNGGVPLDPGTYEVWCKIVDPPQEAVIKCAGVNYGHAVTIYQVDRNTEGMTIIGP